MKQQRQPLENVKYGLPLDVSLIVTVQGNSPSVLLRRQTNDLELLKILVTCALNDTPIVIMPSFNNKIRAICSLKEKGIIYEKEKEYYFNF